MRPPWSEELEVLCCARPDVGAACVMARRWGKDGPTVKKVKQVNKTINELKKTTSASSRFLWKMASGSFSQTQVLEMMVRRARVASSSPMRMASWRRVRLAESASTAGRAIVSGVP